MSYVYTVEQSGLCLQSRTEWHVCTVEQSELCLWSRREWIVSMQ